MLATPETRFARVGDDRVAYQVLGEGPRDLLCTEGFYNLLETAWEDPGSASYIRKLASFARVIRFDRRGAGLSDRPTNRALSSHTLTQCWVEDCAAVLDAADSRAPVLMGVAALVAGGLVLRFVGQYPSRCSGLIFANTAACWVEKPGYPVGASPQAVLQFRENMLREWGTVAWPARVVPSRAQDSAFLRWFAKVNRSMASPRTAAEALDAGALLDARDVLPSIRVPTLVLARRTLRVGSPARARYLAEHIPGARYVELAGEDQLLSWENPDESLAVIEEFMTGGHRRPDVDRRHATVLFTDIVESTHRAAALGDAAWRRVLDDHDRVIREQLTPFSGRFIEASGDGTLSLFDTPRHAIDCAFALSGALAALGIPIRAGLHCGEVEVRDDGRIGGIAVHLGARVVAVARAGEVLASPSVQVCMLGSNYAFEERGVHELKGIPGRWPLYAVRPSAPH